MSGLIKAQDAAAMSVHIRSLFQVRPAPDEGPKVPVELSMLRQEVESLQASNKARTEEIERLRDDIGRAYREGEAEGRKAGLAQADQRRTEQFAIIKAGVSAALNRFGQEMESMEQLAVLVARQAMAKLLGDQNRHAELLAGLIRHQLEHLEAESVVAVLVSKADFGDADELLALSGSIGRADVEIRASDEVVAGDCRIKLTLGSLEVGPRQQWGRLSAILAALAEPGVEP
jgi:flagellar biosynthesis/type III secretory pathway protein FliH